MDHPASNNLATILEQLAAWANADQASTSQSSRQQAIPNSSHPSILPGQDSPNPSSLNGTIYRSSIPTATSNLSGDNTGDVNTSQSSAQRLPVPQSSSLGVQDHLQRLQQIADAARASRKDSSSIPPGSVYETPLSDHANSRPVEAGVILQWASALRHVSRMGGSGSELEITVRKMIESQRANEESWWKGHERLKIEIEKRNGDEEDLQIYEAKVYKAQLDMYYHMEAQLRSLGVPFFGVPQNLIVETSEEQDGKITRQALRTLQLKMIEYLEDMYGP
jgi:hypothetical protein